jgi:CspA family cold shock protein
MNLPDTFHRIRYSGIVKWFNASRGFGFIGRTDGEDVFAHASALSTSGSSSLLAGERVSFEIRETAGRRQAIDVRLAAYGPTSSLSTSAETNASL